MSTTELPPRETASVMSTPGSVAPAGATARTGHVGVPGGPSVRRPSGIITPEAVVLEFETAGVGSRMLARLLDGVVLWLGIMVLTLAILPLFATAFGVGVLVSIILVFVLIFFMLFGYWMLLETLMQGRTIGKAAMGLRVITVEGAPVRFRHAAIRAMVGFVDFLTPPLGPVAVLSVLASPRDQRLGDMAAGTIVVRERSVAGPVQVVQMVEPPGRAALLASLSLSPLDDLQYQALRSFLQRATTLDPAARAELADKLAHGIESQTGVARPLDLHPEWYIHAAGLAHQRRFAPVFPSGFQAPLPNSQPPPPTGRPVSAPPPPAPPPLAGGPGR